VTDGRGRAGPARAFPEPPSEEPDHGRPRIREHRYRQRFAVHPIFILTENATLALMVHEKAWSRLEELEAFCMQNALPFSRW
jgi:hypothetical protein